MRKTAYGSRLLRRSISVYPDEAFALRSPFSLILVSCVTIELDVRVTVPATRRFHNRP